MVEHTVVRNTGDDCLAMWSDKQADAGNAFRSNSVQLPSAWCRRRSPQLVCNLLPHLSFTAPSSLSVLANGIAIYGGSSNSAVANEIRDSLTQGGGLHVGNRFSAVPLSGTTTLSGNALVRCGCLDPNWQFGVGALWFYAEDEAMTGAIAVSNTTITASPYEAVQFMGSSVTGVSLTDVNVDSVGTFVFQFQSPGAGSASSVVATGVGYFGQYNCGVQFDLADGGGNAGWNSTHCGFPPAASEAV